MLKDRTTSLSPRMILAALVLVMLALAGCGSNNPGPPAPTEEVFVDPLPPDRPEMAVEGPEGTMPCGLAEVTWGYRVFNVGEEFPNCTEHLPDLTVYCLNAEAQWMDDNISDVHVSMQTETVAFEVRQDGICGLFPQ